MNLAQNPTTGAPRDQRPEESRSINQVIRKAVYEGCQTTTNGEEPSSQRDGEGRVHVADRKSGVEKRLLGSRRRGRLVNRVPLSAPDDPALQLAVLRSTFTVTAARPSEAVLPAGHGPSDCPSLSSTNSARLGPQRSGKGLPPESAARPRPAPSPMEVLQVILLLLLFRRDGNGLQASAARGGGRRHQPPVLLAAPEAPARTKLMFRTALAGIRSRPEARRYLRPRAALLQDVPARHGEPPDPGS